MSNIFDICSNAFLLHCTFVAHCTFIKLILNYKALEAQHKLNPRNILFMCIFDLRNSQENINHKESSCGSERKQRRVLVTLLSNGQL